MTTDRKSLFRFPVGIAAAGLVAGIAGDALAQQRPISINQWLQAESGNVNMQRAIQEYERAQFGTATQPPAYQAPQYRQPQHQQPQHQAPQQPYYPQQQAQTPQPAPQGAPQAAPQQPVQQQPQQLIPGQAQPQGQLPQQPNQQNTYQVPPDALEKIDREYNPSAVDQEQATSPLYVSAHLGLPLIPQLDYGVAGGADFEPLGLYADAGVGFKFDKALSLDIEFSYLSNEFDENNVEGGIGMYAMMANATYEHNVGIGLVPYVTGGIGPALYRIEDATTSTSELTGSDIVFAYQFGTGLMYYISPKTALDLGYMYRGSTDASIDSPQLDYEAEFESHNLMVGLRHQM